MQETKHYNTLYLHLAWPNYGLDVLNITMHTEVVIHSMNAYVWCWSKICGSLDEIPSVTMGTCKSKILKDLDLLFYVAFNSQGHIAMASLQVEEPVHTAL